MVVTEFYIIFAYRNNIKYILMTTIKELQKLTGWSKKQLNDALQELLDAGIIVKLDDEYFNIYALIDLVNEYNDIATKNNLQQIE